MATSPFPKPTVIGQSATVSATEQSPTIIGSKPAPNVVSEDNKEGTLSSPPLAAEPTVMGCIKGKSAEEFLQELQQLFPEATTSLLRRVQHLVGADIQQFPLNLCMQWGSGLLANYQNYMTYSVEVLNQRIFHDCQYFFTRLNELISQISKTLTTPPSRFTSWFGTDESDIQAILPELYLIQKKLGANEQLLFKHLQAIESLQQEGAELESDLTVAIMAAQYLIQKLPSQDKRVEYLENQVAQLTATAAYTQESRVVRSAHQQNVNSVLKKIRMMAFTLLPAWLEKVGYALQAKDLSATVRYDLNSSLDEIRSILI